MGGIRIRPHHLLCIQGFRGQGYSPTFIANMARLKEMLEEVPATRVQIINGSDDICGFCPHLDGGACARPGEQVSDTDSRTMDMLELDDGAMGTWAEFTDCVRDKIQPANLPLICQDCNWIDLGFCAEGVAALSGNDNPR